MAPPPARAPFYACLSSAILLVLTNVVSASLPLVDFDRMGTVGLTGAFAGLGLSDNSTLSVTFDPSEATLLSRSSDGSLTALASTNTGGTIAAGCPLGDVFYFGGTFTSIGNVSASNVASYTPSSGSFAALGSNGPDGAVHALYCDTTNNVVWAGGKFASPGPSVATWQPKSSQWSAPPFGGLSGAAAEVLSITTNSSAKSLFFSGSFVTSFGNGTVLNSTNNPNVPYSSGATPFSSSLVPVPLQNAQVIGEPSSTQSGFDDVQDILCPAGPDGPGNTWFAEDDDAAVITVRAFSLINARGIRVGNTFLDGRGTTGFSVATIPDNAVQTLSYVDPITGQNETCTDPCPLLADSSVPYQDFLFSGNLDITGFQLTLSQWQGAGPGLHLLQLLSSGAFASAIAANNTASCFSPNPSNVTFTGPWTTKQANTDIPGTVETVLVATVAVGTSASQSPSITWMPYVSASGEYDVYLVVPGCTNFEDCALRTSVQVTVFPGEGLQPWVTKVSQQNTDDETSLVYSGPIVPSSPNFVTTISMTLADNPEGSGQDGEYELVAAGVQLNLISANATSGESGGNGTTTSSTTGFGFFEWPLSSTTKVNATAVLSNSTQTTLDGVGIDIQTALGSATATFSAETPIISAVAHHPSGVIFLAGVFNLTSGPASGASNIVMYQNGALSRLASNGLNGGVSSLVLDGEILYVGGSFDDTSSPLTNGDLRGVAMYKVAENQWSSLDGGVGGSVSSLDYSNGQVFVAGNFSGTVGAASDHNSVGFAVWDIGSSAWVNGGGFLVGSMSFVGNGTASDSQFVAGSVESSLQYGSTGFVLLQNGLDGLPQITTIDAQLDANVTSPASLNVVRRRSHSHRTTTSWIPRFNALRLFRREATASLAPLPAGPATPAPAVLAGAFWTNSSSAKQLIVLGGNFSFSASSGTPCENVAIYDNSTGGMEALQGSQINGTVRSLLVQGNNLFVGGEFSLEGTTANGFAVYDLAERQWAMSGVQALQPNAGSSVVVRSVTASPQANSVIVAGTFAQAGSTACRSICSYNADSKQWSSLGNGIQGDVASIAYANDDSDIVVTSGSIALADGTPANVAAYTMSNSSWTALGSGGLPGPVTAITVNDGNISSIFAAGRSADGTTPFLYFWNGENWSSVGSTLESATDVSQLTMVPLQNTHAENNIIQSDRVLMVSGYLADASFGNASSALFDGNNFIPYFVSSSASGSPGTISGLIYSLSTFSFTQNHFLATGVVILISIAIAAGIVFLLALIGILWTLFSRRDDKLNKFDAGVEEDNDSTHRPSSLLEHINAATRTTILGDTNPFGPHMEKGGEVAGASSGAGHDAFEPDASNYIRAETPSDAVGGTMGEETSRPAHARYSFDASGEGELALSAGQELEILDDGDTAWWYARDIRSGREGVVPAAYVY